MINNTSTIAFSANPKKLLQALHEHGLMVGTTTEIRSSGSIKEYVFNPKIAATAHIRPFGDELIKKFEKNSAFFHTLVETTDEDFIAKRKQLLEGWGYTPKGICFRVDNLVQRTAGSIIEAKTALLRAMPNSGKIKAEYRYPVCPKGGNPFYDSKTVIVPVTEFDYSA